jgi:hypothetical protein
LWPEEYQVTAWSYEQYQEVNLAAGWVTPFDPRAEVRVADLVAWKQRALELAQREREQAERWIRERRSEFSRRREIRTVAELAERWLASLPPRERLRFAPRG